MCNCTNPTFSNCAGNPDCKCISSGSTFNQMVGLHSNLTGEIASVSSGVTYQNTGIVPPKIATAPVPTVPPSTTTSFGEKLNNTLTTVTSVLGLFGSKAPASTSTPVPLPEDEEKKIPTAVYVVVGGLLLLVVVFVIVKASKK